MPNDRFEFYHDRLVFERPTSELSRGTIFYDSIDNIEILGRARKNVAVGNIIIRTHSIIGVDVNGIAITGIVLMDIENPEDSLKAMNQILKKYKQGEAA